MKTAPLGLFARHCFDFAHFIDWIEIATFIIFISLTDLKALIETINVAEFISSVLVTRHDSASHKVDLRHLIAIIAINE